MCLIPVYCLYYISQNIFLFVGVSLFPNKIYATTKDSHMSRYMAFIMPISLVMRKHDGFEELYKTTHDSRVLPMILADERCEPLFMGEIYGEKSDDKNEDAIGWHGPILRNYWDDSQMEDDIRHLPLGPRFEFPIVDQKDIQGVDERKYLFNMMVSLDTSNIRQLLEDVLLEAVSKSVKKFPPSNRHNVRLPALHESYIHNSKEWQKDIPTVLENGQLVPTSSYHSVLLNSIFTLCPSGHNPETFRLFEACEAGSIPIVDYTRQASACSNPWKPFIDSRAPFIWIQSWEEDIVNILTILRNDPERVKLMQRKVIEWYHDFMHKTYTETVEGTVRDHLSLWLVRQQEISNEIRRNKNKLKKADESEKATIPYHIKELFDVTTRHKVMSKKKGIPLAEDTAYLEAFVQQQSTIKKNGARFEDMISNKERMRAKKLISEDC